MPASQSQYGGYGQYAAGRNEYGAPSYPAQQQYVPGAPPPAYGQYYVPGQGDPYGDYGDGPARKSRKGLFVGLSIVGVVLVALVGCLVLANVPSSPPTTPAASVAGTWYGRSNIKADTVGTLATETFMTVEQSNQTLAGSGKMCIAKSGNAVTFMTFTLDGSMSGKSAAMTWHINLQTTNTKGDVHLTGTLTNGTLSLEGEDASGNITLGVTKGTEQNYLDACRAL